MFNFIIFLLFRLACLLFNLHYHSKSSMSLSLLGSHVCHCRCLVRLVSHLKGLSGGGGGIQDWRIHLWVESDFVARSLLTNFDEAVCINMSRSASCVDKRQWAFKFVTTFCCPGNILSISRKPQLPISNNQPPLPPQTALLGLFWMSFGCHQTKSHMKFTMCLACLHGAWD